VFGATRGIDRLLDLWEKKNIKCSWYIPGHSIESFPEQIAKIRDAGHEMYEPNTALTQYMTFVAPEHLCMPNSSHANN
jgi:hypothetical protein